MSGHLHRTPDALSSQEKTHAVEAVQQQRGGHSVSGRAASILATGVDASTERRMDRVSSPAS